MKKIYLKNCGKYALVDDHVYEEVKIHNWRLHFKNGKPSAVHCKLYKFKENKFLVLHHVCVKPIKKYQVDHINGNVLDNRLCNLRLATCTENHRNRKKSNYPKLSKYKGVTYDKSRKKYKSAIGIWTDKHGIQKLLNISRFEKEEDAAISYDFFALMLFGEFARTNFKYD